ncbi:MAG: hypothetical protein QM813_05955 [Verrucomicrobiota bacterium]
MTESSTIRPLDSTDASSADRVLGLSRATWVQMVTVLVLVCALFRFNLTRLWDKTNPFNGQDSNWQHSIFVPLIGIYYLYIHREELVRASKKAKRSHASIRYFAAWRCWRCTG